MKRFNDGGLVPSEKDPIAVLLQPGQIRITAAQWAQYPHADFWRLLANSPNAEIVIMP
jgi:hypothetical protein